MNWTIRLVEEGNFVIIETAGHFTGPDNLAMLKDLIEQDYWKTGMNLLVDNRRRDYDDDGMEYIKKSSSNLINKHSAIGCGKIAILMKSVSDFGLGRQFELLTDEEICADVRIFLSDQQALNWIKTALNAPLA